MSSFEIFIDTEAAEARILKMERTLQAVPIPDELTAWQREDMKRKTPNTEVFNPTAARTLIWPRGRPSLAVKKQPRRMKPLLRGKATRIPQPKTVGHKPILRPILFDKLCERMHALMEREVKW
jgi:hypothetical protein